jgi:hypothetical protein
MSERGCEEETVSTRQNAKAMSDSEKKKIMSPGMALHYRMARDAARYLGESLPRPEEIWWAVWGGRPIPMMMPPGCAGAVNGYELPSGEEDATQASLAQGNSIAEGGHTPP